LIRRRFGQRNSLIKLVLPFLLLFLLAIEFLLPLSKFKIGPCQWIASMFLVRDIVAKGDFPHHVKERPRGEKPRLLHSNIYSRRAFSALQNIEGRFVAFTQSGPL